MNFSIINDFKAVIAAYEAKDWIKFADAIGTLIKSGAAFAELFKGLTAEETNARITTMVTTSAAGNAEFGAGEIIAIVQILMKLFEFFKKKNA